MAITIDNIWFETQRRIALYKTGTVMPDSSLLGYDGDPNAVDRVNSDGELLLYYSSQGSLFQQSTGDMWRKSSSPNTWVTIGSGESERVQVLTRSSLNLTFSSSDGNGGNIYYPEFVTVGTDNPAGDARWDDITYAHAMILPYNTTVKKIILRGTATQSATVNIGIHTNSGVTNPNSIEYKYFTETPTATAENTFQFNNEAKVFTFADTTSALEGDTLGISISGTKPISTSNLSIVLAYSD